jgi:hypothetical protein
MSILKDVCSVLTMSVPNSLASWMWKFIADLWPWCWSAIIICLCIWVVVELVTRDGSAHYNSQNGFSPTFNRFIGSGVFLFFQWLSYFLLHLIMGDGVYCLWWPYALHLFVFGFTGIFLFTIGFWSYLRLPSLTRRKNNRRSRS